MTVLPARISLTLEVQGVKGRFRLSSFVAHWVGNQLPQATCQLAVGRNAYTGATAKIHRTAASIDRLAKARVIMRVDGVYDENTRWPNKDIVIFEGRIVGPGQVVGEQMAYTLTLVHWLVDLHHSSTLSSISHPSNPADMTFRAVKGSPMLGSGIVPTGMTMLTVSQVISAGVNMVSLAQDVWGKGLKQILCNLAEQRHVRMGNQFNPCLAVAEGENKQALAALGRIDGVGPKCSRPYSCYAPVPALGFGTTPSAVINALFHGLMFETVQSYVSHTMWSKIIHSYAPALMCTVVPLVDHALFTPVTPGLRETYCNEIGANDYDSARFVFPVTEPLRAVGILSDKGSKTNITGANSAKLLGVGGCFAPEDAHDLGTIRFFRAPTWLNNVYSNDVSVVQSTGLKNKTPISTVYTPQSSANQDIKGGKAIKDEEKKLDEIVEMYRAYAQTIFVTDSLRGRVGMLMGKLRFDIAPGSNVKIHARTEPFIGPTDQLVNTLIGTVTKVSIAIDAENTDAATSFEFSYLRTEEENKSESFSLARHPLFAKSFVGAPLHDELQFGDSCCE